MYIEKLTDKEIRKIFAKILLIIEEGNEDNIGYYIQKGKIEKEEGVIEITFKTAYETHSCFMTDYTAGASYGYYTSEDKVLHAYRKHMYKKFGDEYYEDLRDHYKREIFAKCDKELAKLSNELNEMIKEEV